MSFEGYRKKLCPNGHLTMLDVYEDLDYCETCYEKFVWEEIVDTTNGAGESTNLKLVSGGDRCVCERCGNHHQTLEIYEVPKKKE